MTQIYYFTQYADVVQYSEDAMDYVASESIMITGAASKLGMPDIAVAIAGAMAEENEAYVSQFWQSWYDLYAISDIDLVTMENALAAFQVGGWVAAIAVVAIDAFETRDHEDWLELYNQVEGQDSIYSPEEKLLNPILGDLGYGNFNMLTAIRLLEEHSEDAQQLGINVDAYLSDFALLANDLVYDQQGLTAALYAIMIKEADQWYRDHDAYSGEWDSLPQEIKDALYITYTNIGRGGMDEGYSKSTNNGLLPYEPIPAIDSGGGLNHLYNASAISGAIGVVDYGNVTLITASDDLLEQSKQDTDLGLATREALINLRPFVVMDGDYISEAGDFDNYSDLYYEDRASMLAWKMGLKHEGADVVQSGTTVLYYEDNNTPFLFEDSYSGLTIQLDEGSLSKIVFGYSVDESIVGGALFDHLYGGGGNDIISGGSGRDHIEGGLDNDVLIGGKDSDTLVGGSGYDTYQTYANEGIDTIQDSDGEGLVKLDDIEAKGKTSATGPGEWVQLSSNSWRDNKHGITYTLFPGTDETQNLTITSSKGSVTVLDWFEGMLDIELGLGEPELPFEPAQNMIGDLAPIDTNPTQDGVQVGYDELGNVYVDGATPEPGREDTIYDSEADDLIQGLAGDDDLLAIRGGNDHLEGGQGNDLLKGGTGDDVLYGDDVLPGVLGQDVVLGEGGGDTNAVKLSEPAPVMIELASQCCY